MRVSFRPKALFRFVTGPPFFRKFGAIQVSIALHAAAVAAVVLVPLLWPSAPPEHPDYVRVLIYNPPPPPPPPLPLGAAFAKKPEPARPVTPETKPNKPEFTAPQENPKEAELKPEDKTPETEQSGSETGSESGSEEGMEGGQEGGQVGGTPGGVLGGVIGGTGDEVMDYDQPPRLLRAVKPVYPQEAFIKKVEGTVVLGCSLGPDGRVRKAWVISSTNHMLDHAAIDALMQWSFSPAVKHGRPVATIINAPVTFRIY